MLIKRLKNFIRYFTLALLCSGLCGCICTHKCLNPQDPYENFNRHSHRMNEKLDKVILKPLACLYVKLVPPPLMKGINNFFSNLGQIPTIANDILQLNFYRVAEDTWRFGVNSTAGILGFFDVATHIGLEKQPQDFGLTLARWGYTNSAYFVIPLLGPSTIRDTVGRPIDYELFSVYPWIHPVSVRYSVLGVYYVDARAQLLELEKVRREAALDTYVFDRDAYLQNRKYLINRNCSVCAKDTYIEAEPAGKDLYIEADAKDSVVASNKKQSFAVKKGTVTAKND